MSYIIYITFSESYCSDGSFEGREWSKCGILKFFWSSAVTKHFDFFQLFSTVLKSFCPVDSKKCFCFSPSSSRTRARAVDVDGIGNDGDDDL